MGTNIVDFIQEAHRILVDGGVMWIAEVSPYYFYLSCAKTKVVSVNSRKSVNAH